MKLLVFVNPLKPGKLKAYKAFAHHITGPGKVGYDDMLKRYGLLTTQVYYHKIADREFVMVIHESEDGALERLAHFASSTHPYDHWFLKQLHELHDFDLQAGQATHLFSYVTA